MNYDDIKSFIYICQLPVLSYYKVKTLINNYENPFYPYPFIFTAHL